jgi:ActR/RegA family two-component response regulator
MPKSFAYPTLDGLLDLACRDGIDIRPTLLRVLTDLYVQKPVHTADEEVQFVELALRLIEAVDAVTRATVAARLSRYPAAPAAILRKLAVTASATGADAAPEAEASAEVDPASGHELVELFFTASPDERVLILTNLDAVAETGVHKVAPAATDVLHRLENAALQRNPSEFSRTLERALGIARALAERIVRDPSGEPTVVAAKALGMPAAVLQRILLFLNPAIGQSVQRVYDLARLYDEITPASAERMLAIWRQSAGRPQGRHEPVLWDDDRASARSQSMPARYRPARSRDPLPSRSKSNGR